MRLAKCLVVGLLAGVVSAIAAGAIAVFFSLGTVARQSYSDGGGGGVAVEVVSVSLVVPLLTGLVVGAAVCVWQWKRNRPQLTVP